MFYKKTHKHNLSHTLFLSLALDLSLSRSLALSSLSLSLSCTHTSHTHVNKSYAAFQVIGSDYGISTHSCISVI